MSKIRYILQTTRSCYRTWRCAPRILTLLGMIACFAVIYAVPFVDNARAQGESLQITEVFIAMMNWRFTMLLFSTAVLLLFGDLPVIEAFTGNAMVKGTRKGWIVGQILYVITASFLLTLFIFLVSILVCLPDVNLANEWSRPVKLLATSGRIAISPERMRLPFPKSIITEYTPWTAFSHSFLLFFLMGCFYGLVSLALRMKFKSASFVLLMLFNTLSWAAGMFTVQMKAYAVLSTLSTHYHASLYLHEGVSANSMLPTLGMSYVILIGVSLLLVVVSLIVVHTYDYVQMEAEHI